MFHSKFNVLSLFILRWMEQIAENKIQSAAELQFKYLAEFNWNCTGWTEEHYVNITDGLSGSKEGTEVLCKGWPVPPPLLANAAFNIHRVTAIFFTPRTRQPVYANISHTTSAISLAFFGDDKFTFKIEKQWKVASYFTVTQVHDIVSAVWYMCQQIEGI